jgi:RNA polymerase sigma-70 factor (ECF subfamily)
MGGALLESVYRAFAPGVAGYLRAQGASDPDDLTGEVFVAVARRLDDFHGDDADLRSWVFTIAHHKLVDDRRRRARRRTDPTDPAALPEPSQRGFEDAAATRLDALPAMAALQRLTPDQQAVVLLRILADLSIAQVAKILDKPEGAVKTLQRRALASLARHLTPAPERLHAPSLRIAPAS